jgi:hypothetical protein
MAAYTSNSSAQFAPAVKRFSSVQSDKTKSVKSVLEAKASINDENEFEFLERYGWSAAKSRDFYLNSTPGGVGPSVTFFAAACQLMKEAITVFCTRLLLGFVLLVPSAHGYDGLQAFCVAFVHYLTMRNLPNVNAWSTMTLLGYSMTTLQKMGRSCSSRGKGCANTCSKIGVHMLIMFLTLGVQFGGAVGASFILTTVQDNESLLKILGNDSNETGFWVGLRSFAVTTMWLILYTIHGVAIANKRDGEENAKIAAQLVDRTMSPGVGQTAKSSSEAHMNSLKEIADYRGAIEAKAVDADEKYWLAFALFILAEEVYFGPRLGFGFEIFIPLSIAVATGTDYVARIYTISWLFGVLISLFVYVILYLPLRFALIKWGPKPVEPNATMKSVS